MKLNEFSLHSASLQKATMYLSLNITEKTHARPLEHLKKKRSLMELNGSVGFRYHKTRINQRIRHSLNILEVNVSVAGSVSIVIQIKKFNFFVLIEFILELKKSQFEHRVVI